LAKQPSNQQLVTVDYFFQPNDLAHRIQMTEVVNYYKQIKKEKGDCDTSYPNEDKIQLKLPFRMLIMGPSGSGKTNALINLICQIGVFERVLLLAKDTEEPLYKLLREKYAKVEKKTKEKMFFSIEDIKKLPPVESWEKCRNNLLIIDDQICESPKDLVRCEEYFVWGRKRGLTMIFLTQDYFATPKRVRRNSNVIIMKKLNTVRDMTLILKEFELGITKDQLKANYERACGHGTVTDFFLIDKDTTDPRLKFRKGFDPL
jgi:hypothetical protein